MFITKKNVVEVDEFVLASCECERCHEEKVTNKFGLCHSCQTQVDEEYADLYVFRTMDYKFQRASNISDKLYHTVFYHIHAHRMMFHSCTDYDCIRLRKTQNTY